MNRGGWSTQPAQINMLKSHTIGLLMRPYRVPQPWVDVAFGLKGIKILSPSRVRPTQP